LPIIFHKFDAADPYMQQGGPMTGRRNQQTT